MSEKSAGCATRGSSGGTGHIKSTAVLRESLPVALDLQNSPPVPRKLLPVARGRIFGDGCANRSCYAVTGFRANRRERTSGPDEGGDAAKQKDGVCPTTLDRAECPDQKEEFAVQPTRRTSQPFPDVSPKACGGKADGPRQQGTRPEVAEGTRSAATPARRPGLWPAYSEPTVERS